MRITRTDLGVATRFTAIAAAGALLLVMLFSPIAGAAPISVGGGSDCDSNAIIRCGAHSTPDLREKYGASDYAQKVYRAFGISSNDMATLRETNAVGKVTNKGNVYIEGKDKPVASGAVTAGRLDMAGSTKDSQGGAEFYKRPTSVSFQQSSLPAFVSMKDGKFQFAIIASCGNPVMATAIYTPPAAPIPTPAPAPAPAPAAPIPAPAPAPTPAPVQTQTQTQQVVVNTPVLAPTPVQTVAAAPVTLPNTGVAGITGLFALASAAGFIAYRRYLSRRLN